MYTRANNDGQQRRDIGRIKPFDSLVSSIYIMATIARTETLYPCNIVIDRSDRFLPPIISRVHR